MEYHEGHSNYLWCNGWPIKQGSLGICFFKGNEHGFALQVAMEVRCREGCIFCAGVWKGILKDLEWFQNQMLFKVGNGTFVRFWKDRCAGPATLEEEFPEIFVLAQRKNGMVADHLGEQGAGAGWDLGLCRPLNDWEMEAIDGFISISSLWEAKGRRIRGCGIGAWMAGSQ